VICLPALTTERKIRGEPLVFLFYSCCALLNISVPDLKYFRSAKGFMIKFWSGVFAGVSLGLLQFFVLTSIISRFNLHISWALSKELEANDWNQAYNLRGAYLNEQASALMTAPNLNLKSNYRMIIFEGSGRILICADSGTELSTGFLFPTTHGFKTVMPDRVNIIYEINKICSIRI
jgi:hypothetical protein